MKVAVDTLPSRFEAIALEVELARASIAAEVGERDDGWVVLVDDRELAGASKRVADLKARSSTTRGSLRDLDDAALGVLELGVTAATGVARARPSRWFWLFIFACGVIAWWLA